MTYLGKVQGGVIVLEGPDQLEEGTVVKIEPVVSSPSEPSTVGQRLIKWAGKLQLLPSDSSVNVDHYLYGHPKK